MDLLANDDRSRVRRAAFDCIYGIERVETPPESEEISEELLEEMRWSLSPETQAWLQLRATVRDIAARPGCRKLRPEDLMRFATAWPRRNIGSM